MCDRTSEFLALINSGKSGDLRGNADKSNRSGFFEAASEIGTGIEKASQLLNQLAKLVRRQGLFDDSSKDIEHLTMSIRQELTELNNKCDNAQMYVDSKRSSLGKQNQCANYNGAVVNQLKSDLMVTTKEFKAVLELRTNKMNEHNSRKANLTGNGVLSPFKQLAAVQERQKKEGSVIGSNLANPYAEVKLSNETLGTRRRNTSLVPSVDYSTMAIATTSNASDDAESFNRKNYNQLLVAPPAVETQYYDAREKAVTEVEKTIQELGSIFRRLSSMISEQQEQVDRIDQDIEAAQHETQSVKDYLTDVYNGVSSNRGLYMKLSAILVVFIIFFTLFLM